MLLSYIDSILSLLARSFFIVVSWFSNVSKSWTEGEREGGREGGREGERDNKIHVYLSEELTPSSYLWSGVISLVGGIVTQFLC